MEKRTKRVRRCDARNKRRLDISMVIDRRAEIEIGSFNFSEMIGHALKFSLDQILNLQRSPPF